METLPDFRLTPDQVAVIPEKRNKFQTSAEVIPLQPFH